MGSKHPPRFGFGIADSPPPMHDLWEEDLLTFVGTDGLVDYKAWQADDSRLNTYLKTLGTHPPQTHWSKSQELAYWINAYNAFTIRVILDHYPVQSIKDIGDAIPMINSVWDIPFVQIGDQKISLNDIEHHILRQHYGEPRIHFAINCASIGCPVLSREAYTAEDLEQQLDQQSEAFINDPTKNIIGDKSLELSPIFKWFSEDFKSKEQLLSLIEKHTSQDINTVEISYGTYDWNLNDRM